MGVGDWILASGEVKSLPHRVVFGNGIRAHWSDIFEGNPRVARHPGKDVQWYPNYPGHRTYALGADKERFYWNESYRAPYGEVFLTDAEKDWAQKRISGDYIVVEPNIKDDISHLFLGRNKAWSKWGELLKADYPWVQLGTKAPQTRHVRTDTFRQAMAVLAGARLYVGTDGALHHAAAALGVPAIVLWGGLIGPKILGYPTHTNIWNGAESCGIHSRLCPHCKEAMESITVDQVRKHL